MKQALLDLQLTTSQFLLKPKKRKECIDQILDAARWLFASRCPQHLFSAENICQRLGVDARKLAAQVFENLPAERQEEIRVGLRHYRCALLPVG